MSIMNKVTGVILATAAASALYAGQASAETKEIAKGFNAVAAFSYGAAEAFDNAHGTNFLEMKDWVEADILEEKASSRLAGHAWAMSEDLSVEDMQRFVDQTQPGAVLDLFAVAPGVSDLATMVTFASHTAATGEQPVMHDLSDSFHADVQKIDTLFAMAEGIEFDMADESLARLQSIVSESSVSIAGAKMTHVVVDPFAAPAVSQTLGSRLIEVHSQKMTAAAKAMADRKTFGHLS